VLVVDDTCFPIISTSLGGVDLSRAPYSKYIQVTDACAEVKKEAKKITGSSYYYDQREAV